MSERRFQLRPLLNSDTQSFRESWKAPMSQSHYSAHSALGPWALPLPPTRTECALMFATRRMATLGLRDATATMLAIDLFGAGFRRPLVLLRAFVGELSFTSHRPIKFARCCTPAMTADERLILQVLSVADTSPGMAEQGLRKLTQNPHVCEPLAAAVVFAQAAARSVRAPSPGIAAA